MGPLRPAAPLLRGLRKMDQPPVVGQAPLPSFQLLGLLRRLVVGRWVLLGHGPVDLSVPRLFSVRAVPLWGLLFVSPVAWVVKRGHHHGWRGSLVKAKR